MTESNVKVAQDAIKVAEKISDWDGVLHLYKVVSIANRWNATERGILHEALARASAL